jgi:hypothetical protein
MATKKNVLVCSHCCDQKCTYCGIVSSFEDGFISLERARSNAAVPFEFGGKSNSISGLKADSIIMDDPMEETAYKTHAKPRKKSKAHAIADVHAKARKAGYWAPGRDNAIADNCACCGMHVYAHAGFLAKKNEDHPTWRVVCGICLDYGFPFKTSAPVTPKSVQEAGKNFFADRANGDEKFFVYPLPEVGSQDRLKAMIEKSLELQKLLHKTFMSDIEKSVEETLLFGSSVREVTAHDFSRPEETKATGRMIAFTGNNSWIDCADKTGLRDTSLSAGWGEMQPSRERQHRSRRPKRCGW